MKSGQKQKQFLRLPPTITHEKQSLNRLSNFARSSMELNGNIKKNRSKPDQTAIYPLEILTFGESNSVLRATLKNQAEKTVRPYHLLSSSDKITHDDAKKEKTKKQATCSFN